MGVDYNIARASLRVSCSVNNKPEDLAAFLEALLATQKLESLYV